MQSKRGFWEKRGDRLSTYFNNWWKLAIGREPEIKLRDKSVDKVKQSKFHNWLIRTSMIKQASWEQFLMSRNYIEEGAAAYDRHKFVKKCIKKAKDLSSVPKIDELVNSIAEDYKKKGWYNDKKDTELQKQEKIDLVKSCLKQHIVDKQFWATFKNTLKRNREIKTLYNGLKTTIIGSLAYSTAMKDLKKRLANLPEYQLFSSVHIRNSEHVLEWHLKQSLEWENTHRFNKTYQIDYICPLTGYSHYVKTSRDVKVQKSRIELQTSRKSSHSQNSRGGSQKGSQKLKAAQLSPDVPLSPASSPRFLEVKYPSASPARDDSVSQETKEKKLSPETGQSDRPVKPLDLSSLTVDTLDSESKLSSLSPRSASDTLPMPMPTLGKVISHNPLVYPFVATNAVVSGLTEGWLRLVAKSKPSMILLSPVSLVLVIGASATKAATKLGAEIVNAPVTIYDEVQEKKSKRKIHPQPDLRQEVMPKKVLVNASILSTKLETPQQSRTAFAQKSAHKAVASVSPSGVVASPTSAVSSSTASIQQIVVPRQAKPKLPSPPSHPGSASHTAEKHPFSVPDVSSENIVEINSPANPGHKKGQSSIVFFDGKPVKGLLATQARSGSQLRLQFKFRQSSESGASLPKIEEATVQTPAV